jgi:hypothetical protein
MTRDCCKFEYFFSEFSEPINLWRPLFQYPFNERQRCLSIVPRRPPTSTLSSLPSQIRRTGLMPSRLPKNLISLRQCWPPRFALQIDRFLLLSLRLSPRPHLPFLRLPLTLFFLVLRQFQQLSLQHPSLHSRHLHHHPSLLLLPLDRPMLFQPTHRQSPRLHLAVFRLLIVTPRLFNHSAKKPLCNIALEIASLLDLR